MASYHISIVFFFNDTATTEIYTLSLHDALPISDEGGPRRLLRRDPRGRRGALPARAARRRAPSLHPLHLRLGRDRKSTRLNSSHQIISYAVFCLKKKKQRRALID